MTFLVLQDRIMGRFNRTSTDARTRIKGFINERVRALQSSVGLGRLRRGTVSVNTTSGNSALTTTGLVKIFTVTIPTEAATLSEISLHELRQIDPAGTHSGRPTKFAIKTFAATSVSIVLYPKPDAVYAVSIDGLLIGTDLSADADVPGMPEDFHDAIIFGALADEYDHDGNSDGALRFESRYEARKRELRYFVAKSALTLSTRQNNSATAPWWYVRVSL